jgi:hypothetical protein
LTPIIFSYSQLLLIVSKEGEGIVVVFCHDILLLIIILILTIPPVVVPLELTISLIVKVTTIFRLPLA